MDRRRAAAQWALCAALLNSGCGDNLVDCETAPTTAALPCCSNVFIVAHEDDDLLFMNPDVEASVAAGHHVVVVYVTAGELGDPTRDRYWLDRERGSVSAYDDMLTHGAAAWYAAPPEIPSGWTTVADSLDGLELTSYRSESGAIELDFLRLGDFQTQCLWENASGCSRANPDALTSPYLAVTKACPADEVGCIGTENVQHVSRAQLIAVLTSLILRADADSVATLDSTNLFFDALGRSGGQTDGRYEYWDHYFTALFAITAATNAQIELEHPLSVSSYRGYTIALEPPDLSDGLACRKSEVFARYAIYDSKIVRADDRERFASCSGCSLKDDYGLSSPASWMRRLYPARTSPPTSAFLLRNGSAGCVSTDAAGQLAVAPCDDSHRWYVTPANALMADSGAGCLEVTSPEGHTTDPPPDCTDPACSTPPVFPPDPVRLGNCTTPGAVMFVSSSGQIRTASGRCLAVDGGTLQSEDCLGTREADHAVGLPVPAQAWLVER